MSKHMLIVYLAACTIFGCSSKSKTEQFDLKQPPKPTTVFDNTIVIEGKGIRVHTNSNSICFVDENTYITGCDSGSIIKWHAGGKYERIFQCESKISCLISNPDFSALYIGTSLGEIIRYDTTKELVSWRINAQKSNVIRMKLSNDENTIVAVYENGFLSKNSTKNIALAECNPIINDEIYEASFSQDMKRILFISSKYALIMFDFETMQEKWSCVFPKYTKAAFTRNDRNVVACTHSPESSVDIIDVTTGKYIRSIGSGYLCNDVSSSVTTDSIAVLSDKGVYYYSGEKYQEQIVSNSLKYGSYGVVISSDGNQVVVLNRLGILLRFFCDNSARKFVPKVDDFQNHILSSNYCAHSNQIFAFDLSGKIFSIDALTGTINRVLNLNSYISDSNCHFFVDKCRITSDNRYIYLFSIGCKLLFVVDSKTFEFVSSHILPYNVSCNSHSDSGVFYFVSDKSLYSYLIDQKQCILIGSSEYQIYSFDIHRKQSRVIASFKSSPSFVHFLSGRDGSLLRVISSDISDAVTLEDALVSFYGDNRLLVCFRGNKKTVLQIYSVEDFSLLNRYSIDSYVYSLSISDDGKTLIAATDSNDLLMCKMSGASLDYVRVPNRSGVLSLFCSCNTGKYFYLDNVGTFHMLTPR